MLVVVAVVMALMDKSIVGKYISIFLAVSLFVAANFQLCTAKMGYPSTAIPMKQSIPRFDAVLWNTLPVFMGNILSGTLLVALPFIEFLLIENLSKTIENSR